MTAASSLSSAPGLRLVKFNSDTPGTITDIGAFSGMVGGQSVRSLDFRPSTGVLYAISTDGTTAGQLYTVNLTTAVLTPVGSGFTLGNNNAPSVEMDFNPVLDIIRVVTRANGATNNNNFRVNPTTGALISTDTNLAYASGDPLDGQPASVAAAAYSNNVAGAGTTTLYAWDYNFDSLDTIGGPNGTPSADGGQLFTVDAPANVLTFNAGMGMDISASLGWAKRLCPYPR